MDLALLVYGISLLHGLGAFTVAVIISSVGFFCVFGMWYITETDEKSYYDPKTNAKRVANGVMCVKYMKRAVGIGVAAAFLLVFIPTEKTAYTMVGAFAENDKVQQMSGKVLAIIEQKLDNYIDEGVQEAQDKLEKKSKRKEK
jgi:hypothetical protein